MTTNKKQTGPRAEYFREAKAKSRGEKAKIGVREHSFPLSDDAFTRLQYLALVREKNPGKILESLIRRAFPKGSDLEMEYGNRVFRGETAETFIKERRATQRFKEKDAISEKPTRSVKKAKKDSRS